MRVNTSAPLVEFMYLVFIRMLGESYRRRLRSFLLYFVLHISSANQIPCLLILQPVSKVFFYRYSKLPRSRGRWDEISETDFANTVKHWKCFMRLVFAVCIQRYSHQSLCVCVSVCVCVCGVWCVVCGVWCVFVVRFCLFVCFVLYSTLCKLVW